ncbi:MAG: hypothetical protein JXR56_03745 [Candidatus Cloacimonetes bacterium]|nr:hypothetical protein [Candidatus Cloacimonadota bacterium]
MKKIILLLSVLLIAFSAFAVDRDPLTLSNHGPSLTYFWHAPDQYGDVNQGVAYTAPTDCTLTSWDILFYSTVGTPPSIVVHVYDDNAGVPGTELGSVTVPWASLTMSTSVWNTIDLTGLALSFSAGETFYITYTVTLGSYGIAEVTWLSDDGTYATTNRTYQYDGSTWMTMATGWGGAYEMFAEANIETTGTVGPIFSTNYTSYDYGMTAIGGAKYDMFTISNIGGGDVVVQSVILSGSTDYWVYDPNEGTYPITLGSSEVMQYYVFYEPTDLGDDIGNVAITIDDREVHDIPLSGSGYIHNSWADAGTIFDQSPAGNQGDNPWTMMTSDLDPGYLHAENFFDLAQDIGSIDFWGINWFHDGTAWQQVDTEDPMTFEIIFYDNDVDGLPGNALYTYAPTIARTTVVDTLFSSGPVYKYHYELQTPITLADGWISIQGTSVGTPDDAWFMWSTSPLGDTSNANFNTAWDWDDMDAALAIYPPATADIPENVAITMSGDSPLISWTDVPGMNNRIYRADTPNGAYNIVGIVTNGSGSFIDASATGNTYFYYVTATNEAVRNQMMIPRRTVRQAPIKSYNINGMMK